MGDLLKIQEIIQKVYAFNSSKSLVEISTNNGQSYTGTIETFDGTSLVLLNENNTFKIPYENISGLREPLNFQQYIGKRVNMTLLDGITIDGIILNTSDDAIDIVSIDGVINEKKNNIQSIVVYTEKQDVIDNNIIPEKEDEQQNVNKDDANDYNEAIQELSIEWKQKRERGLDDDITARLIRSRKEIKGDKESQQYVDLLLEYLKFHKKDLSPEVKTKIENVLVSVCKKNIFQDAYLRKIRTVIKDHPYFVSIVGLIIKSRSNDAEENIYYSRFIETILGIGIFRQSTIDGWGNYFPLTNDESKFIESISEKDITDTWIIDNIEKISKAIMTDCYNDVLWNLFSRYEYIKNDANPRVISNLLRITSIKNNSFKEIESTINYSIEHNIRDISVDMVLNLMKNRKRQIVGVSTCHEKNPVAFFFQLRDFTHCAIGNVICQLPFIGPLLQVQNSPHTS